MRKGFIIVDIKGVPKSKVFMSGLLAKDECRDRNQDLKDRWDLKADYFKLLDVEVDD